MIYPNPALLWDSTISVFLNDKYKPAGIYTYCNFAVNDIATRFEFLGFQNKLANDMYYIMKGHKKWQQINQHIYSMLNTGYLIVAAQLGEPHGHVVVLRPGSMVYSKKWNKEVSKCLNVGKVVTIDLGVNWAFDTEPEYFVYLNG